MPPVIVGRIGKTYGIKGWLKIHSYTQPTDNLFDYLPWQVKRAGKWQTVKLTGHKPHGDGFVAKLADVNNPEVAQTWVNADIAVERGQLPDLPDDDYYWQDLIDLQVIDMNGRVLGKVIQLFATGANDVLVVNGEKEFLIPYVLEQVIQHIDLDKRQIQVNWDVDD